MNEKNEFEFIEILETIRNKFSQKNYRFIIAESLVVYFYSLTKSPSEIKNRTNKILKLKYIDNISRGFVRNIIEKMEEEK